MRREARWRGGIGLLMALAFVCRADAADQSLTIAGTCLQADGQRIVGARVKLYWFYASNSSSDKLKLRGEIETASDGVFRFANVPVPIVGYEGDRCEYRLVATHARFASAVITPASTHQIRADHDQLHVTLEPPGVLSGTVIGPEGKPIAGATVFRPAISDQPLADIWRDVTDEQGRYCISDLPIWDRNKVLEWNGTAIKGVRHIFHVRHPDFGEKLGEFGEIPAAINFRLELAGMIEGVVIDTVTGRPAAGVKVWGQGIHTHSTPRTATDENGHYRLDSLAADRYNVWAQMPGRTGVAVGGLNVWAGDVVKAPDLELIPGGFIVGRVLHHETKEPMASTPDGQRLTVALEGPSRPRPGAAVESVAVAEDGSFRVRAAPGENRIYLQFPWMMTRPPTGKPEEGPVLLREGETVTIDIYVDPQASKPSIWTN